MDGNPNDELRNSKSCFGGFMGILTFMLIVEQLGGDQEWGEKREG